MDLFRPGSYKTQKQIRNLNSKPVINKNNFNENLNQIRTSYKNNDTPFWTAPVTFRTRKKNEYMQKYCIFFGLCVAGIVELET
jgi:hypothetical protein